MTDLEPVLRDVDPLWLTNHMLRLIAQHATSPAVEIEVLRQVSRALRERAEEQAG